MASKTQCHRGLCFFHSRKATVPKSTHDPTIARSIRPYSQDPAESAKAKFKNAPGSSASFGTTPKLARRLVTFLNWKVTESEFSGTTHVRITWFV
jgi:hypothetical protein